MGFLLTSLIFAAIGFISSFFARICFNKGPSANLFHLTLVITATVCCWMIMSLAVTFGSSLIFLLMEVAFVGNCLSCTNESTHCPYSE